MSTSNRQQYDVVIVGGGAVGCALARELSKYKLAVTVVEMFAEIGFGTSKANSGIVHPGHHDKPGSVKGSVVVRGNALVKQLASQLGFGYRQCGEVMVAKTKAEFDALTELSLQAKQQGVPVEMWDGDKLHHEEPNLNKELVGGLFAPTCGVVNPYEMVHALMRVAKLNGVGLKDNSPVTKITQITGDKSHRFLVKTDTEEFEAKYVVNCAGIWADKIAELVGLNDFVIKPRKGEEYLLDKQMSSVTSRVIFPVPSAVSKGILIIPTVDHTIMVGPTAVDTNDRWDFSTTSDGCTAVFNSVREMCSSISDRYVIASFAGLRAASNTGDFIIGPTKVKGFINAAGIQSPGLTSAPAIAEVLVNILGKEGLDLFNKDHWIPVGASSPKFFNLSPEEQDKKSKDNHLFAKVVCRCELVTEGDIHASIDDGAKCLDGVKFRTRAGMGRCQGGFCTSRIVQILSQRLGVPLANITKRGANTQIVYQEISELAAIAQGHTKTLAFPSTVRVIDVAVIGGGPAGLAAGVGARQNGARDVVVFDREEGPGGILNQCIHAGFGLHYFKEELTGPEYAQRFVLKAIQEKVRICTNSFVMDVEELPGGTKKLRVLMGGLGVKTLVCKSLVLAMGCRERSRASIKIPGTRPAGIFTAGLAQRFVNLYGHLPGKRIVILGSGDIGLIMARRMTLEHCQVLGVFEIMATCSGLHRNVVQCLHDYNIPLHLSHTVVRVHGTNRLEKVTVAPVDPITFKPDMSRAWDIECDCLLLSVGLIPENEISKQLSIKLNSKTSGPIVSSSLMTTMSGVFACGNVLHVHDLVDNVSKEGLLAGKNAAKWALNKDTIFLIPGNNVSYVLPETLCGVQDQIVSMRVRKRIAPAVIRIGPVLTKHMPVASPSEMIRVKVSKERIQMFMEQQLKKQQMGADGTCTLCIDIEEDTAEASTEISTSSEQATEVKQDQLKAGQKLSSHICLCCPRGCEMHVVSEGHKVLSTVGAACSRGINYAEQEIVDPRRFIATTVPIAGALASKMPVKISKPLPKDKLVLAAAEIQKVRLVAPVSIGTVLIKDLLGEPGCDVVTCRTLLKAEEEGVQLAQDMEFTTKLTVPDITILYDAHDGHTEELAQAIADELQEQSFEATCVSSEEIDLDQLAAFNVVVVAVPDEPWPGTFQALVNKVHSQKPGSMNKVKFALFGLSAQAGLVPKAVTFEEPLKAAGAVKIFELGNGYGVSATYLLQAKEWAAKLAGTVGAYVKQKGASAEGAKKRKAPAKTKILLMDEEEEKVDPILNIEDLPNCYCKATPTNTYSISASPDKWLNVIITRKELFLNVVELRIICPSIAQFCSAGQFVMVSLSKKSERIPLTIADFSAAEGWITVVIQNVGLSSRQLCYQTQVGQRFYAIAGPLGHKSEIKKFGTVICVAGGLGVAPVFPIQRALKLAGNRVICIIGAKTKEAIMWEDQMRAYADKVFISTDDGSVGVKGYVRDLLKSVIEDELKVGNTVDRVVAIGPPIMMRTCTAVVPKTIPCIVSLNTIMVDGTGMCGGCRITTGKSTQFVCVDGPEFNGHDVDWDILSSRLDAYKKEEKIASDFGTNSVTPVATPAPKPKSRVPMPAQDPVYRATNFHEVALGYTPEMAIEEASRCKQCDSATCRDGCPVGVDIKGFIKLIQKRQFSAAAKHIKKFHACPAIAGRVCPQETQCEATCYLKTIDKVEPVAIGNLERFVADWEAAHCDEEDDEDTTGDDEDEEEGASASNEGSQNMADKKVAIVGAGPAGIICGAELAKKGIKVTIFEALSASGGVLIYGIPEFRLPKTIVARESNYLSTDLGVEFRFNHPIGPAGSVADLLKEGYNAVFIGTGAGLPWFMGIEGENLKGVYSSNEFLTRVNLMKAYKFPEYPTPVLQCDSVAVVGGGNVAMDAARCAKRLGAKEVYIVYRRTRAEMPARVDEGIIFKELCGPVKIIGDKNGYVSGMEVQFMELGAPDKSGRRRPIPVEKFELLKVQQVIMAIGNGPNPMLTKASPEIEVNKEGHIQVNKKSQMTSVPGVFAGGDITTGAATVIEAMGAGKRAAGAILEYLSSK